MDYDENLPVNKFKHPEICSKSSAKKDFLRPRDERIDFEKKVNTSQIIPRINGKARVGEYCEICEYAATDSANYLDHINGKQHQKNMNMSMRIQRSTVEEVQIRFDANLLKKSGKYRNLTVQEVVDILKKKNLKKDPKHNCNSDEEKGNTDVPNCDIEEEEEKIKDKRREERKAGKKRRFEPIENNDLDDDDGMTAIMGIQGFGGSKKGH